MRHLVVISLLFISSGLFSQDRVIRSGFTGVELIRVHNPAAGDFLFSLQALTDYINSQGGGATNHSELTLDDGTNPHGTTKSDVGLGNVDNTSDLDKPISTATQTALDNKQALLVEGPFVDGDKSKLDGVENNATADQSGSEIVSAIDTELGNSDWQTDTDTDTQRSDEEIEDITGSQFNHVNHTSITAIYDDSSGEVRLTATADGSIDTHSDVDVTTVTPTTGDVLEYDGSNFVPAAPSGGSSQQIWYIGGRWYGNNTNNWYSFHQWYSGQETSKSQGKGNGATPQFSSGIAPAGLFLPSGTTVKAAYFGGRRSSTAITGVRLYLRAERDFTNVDKNWNEEVLNVNTTFTGALTTDNDQPFVVSSTNINYTTDRDTMLIPFVQAGGVLSGTVYFYGSLTVILEYP